MFDVSITACKDYSQEEVERALKNVLEPIGGLDWVTPGMTIVIKANLVTFMKPDTAATTHPALLCALTKMLKDKGARVIVGDSPGGLYNSVFVGKVYSVTGMKAVEEAGAELNYNFEQSTAQFPKAHVAKHFVYTSYLDEADAIIDFCKLKSHGMMSLSAAVKNMFGVVPGTVKPEYHFRFPDPMDFAGMIIDLNEYFKPRLCIVDAVVGMEGNGPTAGKPRHIGALLASQNPHKLDMVCAGVIGLDPKRVPTLVRAQEYGLAPESLSEISISEKLETFVVEDYDRIENLSSTQFDTQLPGILGKAFGGIAKKALTSVPKVKKNECVGCKQCQNICPAHAITMKNSLPVIDRSICIRCFCCQEFCPKGAMKVKRPAIAKLLNK